MKKLFIPVYIATFLFMFTTCEQMKLEEEVLISTNEYQYAEGDSIIVSIYNATMDSIGIIYANCGINSPSWPLISIEQLGDTSWISEEQYRICPALGIPGYQVKTIHSGVRHIHTQQIFRSGVLRLKYSFVIGQDTFNIWSNEFTVINK